ncbi:MAG: hypothetical protein M1825_006287 [Sarcosagium campestre]|nr:MAG: hypothetical protein M1825_006287 [Sarcosagium campestre]
MSSSQPTGSEKPETSKSERRQSLTKYLNKAKSVLKKDRKRQSVSGLTAITPEASSSADKTPKASTTPAAAVTETPKEQVKSETVKEGERTGPYKTNREAVQQERARIIFEKYGFTLDPSELVQSSHEPLERVEKPIRMRVHRHCHRCNTTFGGDRVCANCTHKRCKKCPRQPVKKPPGVIEVDDKYKVKPKVKAQPRQDLTIPSKTGGQDLIRKPIRQKVVRTCHRCQTRFQAGSTQCGSCQHSRCTKCPREPPKFHKYPDGYPGDVEGSTDDENEVIPEQDRAYRKVKRNLRVECHNCKTVFKAGSKTCAKCDHQRCDQCARLPARKILPEPDPAIVQAVQARLAGLDVKDDSTATT